MRLSCLVAALALCALTQACVNLPRDPEGTLARVEGGRLRVGLVEHPPWVVRTEGEPSGAEVELVRRFAAELRSRPEWHWGGEQRHMEALERFELDLVVGGVTDQTLWWKYVGLTGPYFEEAYAVGFPGAPTPPPKGLKGLEVAVREGDPLAYYLSKEGAVPTRVLSLQPPSGPAAAPTWELESLGLTPSGQTLHTEKHVMAVAPGENGFLRRLEEFLSRERPHVKGLLQKEAVR
ncbi:MAG: transporter substrate-binding domain-containing protein [Acidobacteria bacterium]|nr:transporter substrate-binding domain-containing protein [Acidobacteriota bacterium]